MIKISSTVLLFLISISVFGQFKKIAIGETSEIKAIRFMDDSLGFLVGTNGLFMKTTDQGETWTKRMLADSLNIFDITMATDKTLYAACDQWIFESTDSGATWKNITQYYFDTFYRIKVFDRNLAYAIHEIRAENGASYYVSVSVDSLKTWLPPLSEVLSFPFQKFIDWAYVNKDTIFFASSPYSGIVRTYGHLRTSWSRTIYPTKDIRMLSYAHNDNLIGLNDSNKLFFFSNIFAKEVYEIKLKTTLINSETIMNNLYFIDQNTGLVYGDSGTIFKTFDGGLTWNTFITNTKENLKQHYVLNDSIIFIFGENGTLLKSTNLGGVGISSVKSNDLTQKIKVFPNPANEFAAFRLPSKGQYSIELFNANGKLAYKGNFNGNQIKINVNEWEKGLYLYVIRNQENLINGKLLVF